MGSYEPSVKEYIVELLGKETTRLFGGSRAP